MESRISRIERSVEYLIGKVKKQSEWIHILEDKVRDLEVVNVAENKCLLSDSEKQAITEHGAKFKPSNNQKRDNVIWKAKRFIKEHISNGQKQFHFPEMRAFIFYNIDFKVNKNKRTVTGYLIGTHTGHVHKKVTIKCHPDEVFNEHLGMAIVIGRLLGLDVSEFEDAPQPDSFVNGQIITFPKKDEWYRLHNYKINNIKDEGNELIVIHNEVIGLNYRIGQEASINKLYDYVILDDSDAKYKIINK